MKINELNANKLVIFDIDDTLVHTQTKVHVIKDNRVIKSLNSHEFTHYKLQPGESFDFGDFRDAREFFEKSKPIIPMIDQLKNDIATGNKVVMVTARADFNDRELFLDTFRKYGVDMSKVHVYRAGNMTGKMQTEEKKKIIIRGLLDKGNYAKAIMYDDAIPNLHSFVELKKEYPDTKFYAWHVSLDGKASEYHRTNEGVTPKFPFAGEKVGQKAGIAGQLRGTDKAPKGVRAATDKLVGEEALDMDPQRTDYEIRNYEKLDKYLAELCRMITEAQTLDKDYGMVAAGVLSLKHPWLARVNRPGKHGRIHAEHAAIMDFKAKYGEIPEGTLIITTLSPCNKHMDERDGPACADIINANGIKKVYCGYMDPTQHTGKEDHRHYNLMETQNTKIRKICQQFADTFLDNVDENFADGKGPGRPGDSQRHGIRKGASMSELEKASHAKGRKGQLARWQLNMRRGHKK